MEDDTFMSSGRGTMCSVCGQREPEIGTMCRQCAYGGRGSGLRGNSYANGASVANGPLAWTWPGGMQAPRPESFWDWA